LFKLDLNARILPFGRRMILVLGIKTIDMIKYLLSVLRLSCLVITVLCCFVNIWQKLLLVPTIDSHHSYRLRYRYGKKNSTEGDFLLNGVQQYLVDVLIKLANIFWISVLISWKLSNIGRMISHLFVWHDHSMWPMSSNTLILTASSFFLSTVVNFFGILNPSSFFYFLLRIKCYFIFNINITIPR